MSIHALGPATLGFGFGLATLWVARAVASQWLDELRRYMRRSTGHSRFCAVNAADLRWSRNQQHQNLVSYFMKPLFHNPCTGDTTMLIRYPAGQVNPSHIHPVGHGIYVLSGSLVTHRGTFGPGTFVWFPPNEVMHHGAGPGQDLLALFMVGRGSRTDYAASPSVQQRECAQ